MFANCIATVTECLSKYYVLRISSWTEKVPIQSLHRYVTFPQEFLDESGLLKTGTSFYAHIKPDFEKPGRIRIYPDHSWYIPKSVNEEEGFLKRFQRSVEENNFTAYNPNLDATLLARQISAMSNNNIGLESRVICGFKHEPNSAIGIPNTRYKSKEQMEVIASQCLEGLDIQCNPTLIPSMRHHLLRYKTGWVIVYIIPAQKNIAVANDDTTIYIRRNAENYPLHGQELANYLNKRINTL